MLPDLNLPTCSDPYLLLLLLLTYLDMGRRNGYITIYIYIYIYKNSASYFVKQKYTKYNFGRMRLKCDGTCAATRFHLSAKWTSPFQLARASVQSTTGSRGMRISGSNAEYTMFWGSVKSTCYPLHLPVSPSLPLPCVTVCHHISTGP